MHLKPPPAPSVETWFAKLSVPYFLLDLRTAPANVLARFRQRNDHWNGFSSLRFTTADAFDVVYFSRPVTSACSRG
jgi:hypothetical protein